MARSLITIQADIDNLRASLSSTVSSVSYNGRSKTNATVDEKLRALSALQVELETATALDGGTTRPRQIRLSGSSGFGGSTA